MSASELAAFLHSRRDRIKPEDVGLPAGGRRRAPGLRRSEVAQLAGISPDYYMRLEQGRDVRPSASVLDALARALGMTDDEREHLYLLARAEGAPQRKRKAERVPASILRLLEVMDPVPACVFNGRDDLLAANRLGTAVLGRFATLPPAERNSLRYLFCDPDARTFYPDWETVARQSIANFRIAATRDPDDPATKALVGELSLKSEEFRVWWARHDVRACASGVKELCHPEVGEMALHYDALPIPDAPGQRLVTYTAPAGSPAQDALDLLAMLHPAERAEDHQDSDV